MEYQMSMWDAIAYLVILTSIILSYGYYSAKKEGTIKTKKSKPHAAKLEKFEKPETKKIMVQNHEMLVA